MINQVIYVPDEVLWSEITNGEKWHWINAHINRKLSDCDWTQLPDSGLSMLKRLEWQVYRDELRSIQDDFDNPDDVVLPEPPAEE